MIEDGGLYDGYSAFVMQQYSYRNFALCAPQGDGCGSRGSS
jgi:hypothetical protein